MAGPDTQAVTSWTILEDDSPHRLEIAANAAGQVLLRDTMFPEIVIATTRTSVERFARPVAAGQFPKDIAQQVQRPQHSSR